MAKRKIVVRKTKDVSPQLSLLSEIEGQKYTEEQQNFVAYEGESSVILAAT